MEHIQLRENLWLVADPSCKGGRIRTLAFPIEIKQGIDAWQTAVGIEEGPLLHSITRRQDQQSLVDWAIWAIVTAAVEEMRIERFEADDVRRTCAKLSAKSAATWSGGTVLAAPARVRRDGAKLLQASA